MLPAERTDPLEVDPNLPSRIKLTLWQDRLVGKERREAYLCRTNPESPERTILNREIEKLRSAIAKLLENPPPKPEPIVETPRPEIEETATLQIDKDQLTSSLRTAATLLSSGMPVSEEKLRTIQGAAAYYTKSKNETEQALGRALTEFLDPNNKSKVLALYQDIKKLLDSVA